jgi:hypothetical protein
MAERRSIARKGGVQLDDIELASYHNNWFHIYISIIVKSRFGRDFFWIYA